jgi:DNA replication protein DnaC
MLVWVVVMLIALMVAVWPQKQRATVATWMSAAVEEESNEHPTRLSTMEVLADGIQHSREEVNAAIGVRLLESVHRLLTRSTCGRARGPPQAQTSRMRSLNQTLNEGDDMLREPTMEKLQGMRLGVMATAWSDQQHSADVIALSFDERFAMLVDAEWMARENKRLGRALKEAKLRISEASVEGIDYPPRRELDKGIIRQLGTCKWVEEHQVILITGMTGTGKTYVGCALAQQACRKGYRAMYRRASRFFDELRLARADGSYPRLLARIARIDVLVIDDFAIAPVAETERRDLLEVLEDRYSARATVITSQLPPDRWHDYLADPTVADAICDRVLHAAHRIALKGPSRRKEKDSNNT